MESSLPTYLADYVAGIRRSPRILATLCLRYSFNESADVLALTATSGAMGYRETLAAVHSLVAGELSVSAARELFDLDGLAGLARVMIGSDPTFEATAVISQALRLIRGDAVLPLDTDLIDAQSNLEVGNFDYVADHRDEFEVDPIGRWMIDTELLRADMGRDEDAYDAWLSAFNGLFIDNGLLPISIVPGEGSMFDRLSADVPQSMNRTSPDLPLVTIIVSSFKPGQSLLTAIQSLIEQTWQNLEILLVDDCSPAEFESVLLKAEAMDPRIRLIRMPHNGGTYKIRNHAMSEARGEFVGFKDSDDWAHPQRIERQMEPMLASEDCGVTLCSTVRVHDDLGSVKVGLSSDRWCPSSPLFRRERVLGQLGGFDDVRKGSDTEFTARLDLIFPGQVERVALPLVLTQLTVGSLSRAEFAFQWHHGSRVLYREPWLRWHRAIAAGEASPMLVPGVRRTFSAPDRIVGTGVVEPRSCDALFLSDWGRGIDRYLGAYDELKALIDSGLRVELLQHQTLRFGNGFRGRPLDELLDLQEAGRTRYALWDEDVHAGLLIVRDPELLNFTRPAGAVGFRGDRLMLVADYPFRTPAGWLTYDPAVVENHARSMFGLEPEWLPAHDGIARSLREGGATGEILPAQRFAAVEARPRPYLGMRGGSRAVIGTAGIERPMRDRPTMHLLRQLLPDDDAYDVRLRADRSLVRRIAEGEPLPGNWLVLPDEGLDGFLGQIDVFVGLAKRSWGPELSAETLRALSCGVVAILDPSYRDQFGDAALYARPDEFAEVLGRLVNTPSAFDEQQQRGYAFIRNQVSPVALVDLVNRLGDFACDKESSLS